VNGSLNGPFSRIRTIALVVMGVCVILGAVLLLNLQTPPGAPPGAVAPHATPGGSGAESTHAPPPGRAKTDEPKATPSTVPKPPDTLPAPGTTPTAETASKVTDSDLDYLSAKNLLIPVAGVLPSQLHDTFNEGRSEGRQHQALDIAAPQGTTVLAATDGMVIKLFQSDKGGITLYELDPSGRYVYYYAHLMRYADSIEEGKQLRRGDVIGYVGDTGNAGAGNYHLHFAISKLASPRKWSGGDPINPYPFLSRKQ
jgi:murein DD-endopeptidase MepM/ murein hydrolase activator NlpD